MSGFESGHLSFEKTCTEPAHFEAPAFHAALASSLIFSHLSKGERDRLLAAGDIEHVEAGEIVFHKGDPATRVFCVLTGSVAIEAPGSSVALNRLGPGEMFGEIGVIEGCSRTATVRAAEPCALLAIDQSDFLALLVSHPAIGFRLVASLARRLNHLTDFVGRCCEAGVIARVA